MSIPIGAGVREKASGRPGRVIAVGRHHLMRGERAVQFDGEILWRPVRLAQLDYVARRYTTMRTWDAAQAARG